MGKGKQEPAQSRNEQARRRLARATKKRRPTREEEMAAEIERLQAMRGRSRQQQAELDWLLTLQEIDELKAEIAGSTQLLNCTRQARNDAIAHQAALRLRLGALMGEEPEEVLSAALENSELFAQMSAVNAAVEELKKRARVQEKVNQVRSARLKQLQGQATNLKARAGMPG